MNIQLFLEGQEVELTEDIQFPLTKTYENLSNPTDIVVDYSKSVNIPMTQRNNQILRNAYRLDGTILKKTNQQNIGLYLDPTKKINFKLVYNSNVIMEGYAKFMSSSFSTPKQYYTINLFGAIGSVFQKLSELVPSKSLLSDQQKEEPDGGLKYIIDDGLPLKKLDKQFVYDSWNLPTVDIRDPFTTPGANIPKQIYGMAPSYRGLYSDFSSDSIQTDNRTIKPLSSYFEEEWMMKLVNPPYDIPYDDAKAIVQGTAVNNILSQGLTDNQMSQYLSYGLKPYIYINKLFYIYMNKCKELTGYDIKLDPSWFTSNNPYWSRMCYMFDFLDKSGTNGDIDGKYFEDRLVDMKDITPDTITFNKYTYENTDNNLALIDHVSLNPFNLNFRTHLVYENTIQPGEEIHGAYMLDSSVLNITIVNYLKSDPTNKKTSHFWTSPSGPTGDNYNTMYSSIYDSTNFVEFDSDWSGANSEKYVDIKMRIPSVQLFNNITIGDTLVTEITAEYKDPDYNYVFYMDTFKGAILHPSIKLDGSYMSVKGSDYRIDWRNNTVLKLSSFYNKKEPLFNVLLQYTKMFGLIWDVDYANQTIYIKTRNSYFKDYTIEDWSSRIVRSKEFLIEPVTFSNKYIKFNYKDVNGYRYKGYNTKYGVNYGEKILSADYDFDIHTKDLFNNIYPSCSGSQSYLTFDSLLNFVPDYYNRVSETQDTKTLIESADEKNHSPININNWYLRDNNMTLQKPVIIFDNSELMNKEGQYCYIDPKNKGQFNNVITTYKFPVFDIAMTENNEFPGMEPLGCAFNTPQEDYTYSKTPSKATGHYIYDLYWKQYLNERYNVQNKKITTYIYLKPLDYFRFKFNKFILIDNQLYIVNKILDYNLSTNNPTKCELIQITDPTTYTNSARVFPLLNTNLQDFHYIADKNNPHNTGNGRFEMYVFTSYLDDVDIKLVPDPGATGNLTLSKPVLMKSVNKLQFYVNWKDMLINKNKWTGKIVISIKQGTTVIDTKEIPVSIDYSKL